jgi:hypothetical protein
VSARKVRTPLHLTTNHGQGTVILCGAPKVFTYGALSAGTAHRYIDVDCMGDQHRTDPLLCSDCQEAIA